MKYLPILAISLLLAAPVAAAADNAPVDTNHSAIAGADNQPLAAVKIDSPARPKITADSTSYNEESGRYTLTGNVRINLGSLTIIAPAAKINNSLQVWTEMSTTLTDGELVFSGEALYAELLGSQAWFFGSGCSLTRPGLLIRSDTMSYNWATQTVVFDGHVYCSHRGKNTTASHLEFDLGRDEIITGTIK